MRTPSEGKPKKRSVPASPNAFAGQPQKPTAQALGDSLGPAQPLWDALAGALVRDHLLDVQEWNSYSVQEGWSLRL